MINMCTEPKAGGRTYPRQREYQAGAKGYSRRFGYKNWANDYRVMWWSRGNPKWPGDQVRDSEGSPV